MVRVHFSGRRPTAFSLRLRLHYKAARAAGVRTKPDIEALNGT